jgi:hypothetical protein
VRSVTPSSRPAHAAPCSRRRRAAPSLAARFLTELVPRRHDRSSPEPFPVSFVPFDIRPEHPLAPTETACSSNSREETTATPVRPALRRAPASAIPASGSSRSYPALTHIAERHQPNAYLSWLSQYRRSPSTASLPPTSLSAGPVVRFPQALRPRPRPQFLHGSAPDGRRAASRQRPNSVSDHRYLMACLTKQNPAEPATAGSEGRPSWEPTLSTQLTRDHGSFPNARERS